MESKVMRKAVTSRQEASKGYCEIAESIEGLQWKGHGRIGHELMYCLSVLKGMTYQVVYVTN
jgi:hypothetical protein